MLKLSPFLQFYSFIRKLKRVHIPLLIAFGVLYFIYKIFSDGHVLLNLKRDQIESSGTLTRNAGLKVLFGLALSQFCIGIKFLGDEKPAAVVIMGVLFILTIVAFFLHYKPIVEPHDFPQEDIKVNEEALAKWKKLYSHPLFSEKDYGKIITEAVEEAKSLPPRDIGA